MTKTVRMTSEDPVTDEDIEQLKRLAAMPDELINTDDIPERPFNLALGRERRKAGWTPGKAGLKKAS